MTCSHEIVPFDRSLTVSPTLSMGRRTCRVESLSRSVTVEYFNVSKSIVTPNGIAISSVLAYLVGKFRYRIKLSKY